MYFTYLSDNITDPRLWFAKVEIDLDERLLFSNLTYIRKGAIEGTLHQLKDKRGDLVLDLFIPDQLIRLNEDCYLTSDISFPVNKIYYGRN